MWSRARPPVRRKKEPCTRKLRGPRGEIHADTKVPFVRPEKSRRQGLYRVLDNNIRKHGATVFTGTRKPVDNTPRAGPEQYRSLIRAVTSKSLKLFRKSVVRKQGFTPCHTLIHCDARWSHAVRWRNAGKCSRWAPRWRLESPWRWRSC